MALQRIQQELREFNRNPPLGCTAGPTDEDDYKWEATLVGPPDSLYADALFKLKIQFPADYPFRPPSVSFASPIFHPNINGGSICLEILSSKWSPAVTISKDFRWWTSNDDEHSSLLALLCIRILLQTPNFDSANNGPARDLYRSNPSAYETKVRSMLTYE